MQFSVRLLLTLLLLISCGTLSAKEPDADSIIEILEKISSPYKRTVKANNICHDAWMNGDYSLGLKTAQYALEQAREHGFPKEEGKALRNLGIIYDCKGEYISSSNNFFKALPIFERIGFKNGQADVYNDLGLLYHHQTDLSKAIEYHKKALKLRKELNDIPGISGSYNNIGIIYLDQKKFAPALENLLESVKIDRQLNDERGLGDSYNNIGLIYMNLKDYEPAKEYFKKSLEIRTKYEDKLGLSTSAINLGTLHYNIGEYELAETYLLDALRYSKEIGARSSSMHIYEMLQNVYEEQGKFKEAFGALRNYASYSDSLSNEDVTREQTETEMQYKFDKENLIRKKEQEKLWIGILAATIMVVMLLFFAIFIFRRLKITRNQKKEIEFKNNLVEQKNREILDSINYAKRIQTAILPPEKLVRSYLKDSFIIYKPKDIVAGDFYWMEKTGNLLIFAACDCTGHGVPGALVSVMCHNALNRAVREFNLIKPGAILDKTREIILEEFAKSEDEVNDGMDISLCTLDMNTLKLEWSGANNPLWIVRNNSLVIEEHKPMKQPVGRYSNPAPFNTTVLSLEKNDSLYLFTDGFADQFGGPEGKKFKVKQLKELILKIAEKPLSDQKNELEQVFSVWKGTHEQVDDVCFIGLKPGN